MTIKYNRKLLQKEVDRLYRQAYSVIFVSTLIFMGLGYLSVLLYNKFSHAQQDDSLYIIAVIITGLIGLALGLDKSFRLRLEAQKILCVMSIKEDTELLLSFINQNKEDKKLNNNDENKFVLESKDITAINNKSDRVYFNFK